MKNYKIFTSGKMSGYSRDDQMYWSLGLEDTIREMTDKRVTFIHPPEFYETDNCSDSMEKEAREWEINQLKDSDIVVMNLGNIENSVSTLIELGILTAINNFCEKHIFVVGIGNANINHPWIKLGVNHIESTINEAADYIINYLLV